MFGKCEILYIIFGFLYCMIYNIDFVCEVVDPRGLYSPSFHPPIFSSDIPSSLAAIVTVFFPSIGSKCSLVSPGVARATLPLIFRFSSHYRGKISKCHYRRFYKS